MGAGDYHLVQGRRTITNLSSSRHEALDFVMTYHTTYTKHTGRPGDYHFFFMEIGVKGQQFYS